MISELRAFLDPDLDMLSAFSATPPEVILESLFAEEQERKREFEQELKDAGSCYNPEFLERLAREFAIDPDKMPALKHGLSFAAWLYKEQRAAQLRAAPARQIAKELSSVMLAARRLQSALDGLGPTAARLLWAGETETEIMAVVTSSTRSRYGHTIARLPRGEAIEVRFLRSHELAEAVEVLTNFADAAHKAMRQSEGGRPRDQALATWVANIENQWVKVLGRAFTYDAHRGVGMTKAYGFCCWLLRPLDPKVTDSQLGTAMRRAIRLSRAGRQRQRKAGTR